MPTISPLTFLVSLPLPFLSQHCTALKDTELTAPTNRGLRQPAAEASPISPPAGSTRVHLVPAALLRARHTDEDWTALGSVPFAHQFCDYLITIFGQLEARSSAKETTIHRAGVCLLVATHEKCQLKSKSVYGAGDKAVMLAQHFAQTSISY